MTTKVIMRNIASLVAGNLGAHIVALSVMPILSRMYSQETFGQLGALSGVLAIFAIMLSMRMELTIAESDSFLRPLAVKATLSFIFYCSIFLGPLFIAALFFIYDVSFLVSVLCLIAAIGTALNQLTICFGISKDQFKTLAKLGLIKALSLAFFQLLVYWLLGDSIVALLISLIASLGVFHICSWRFLKSYKNQKKISVKKAFLFVRKKIQTPLYSGSQALINALSQFIPYLVIPFFSGYAALGLFYFADKIFRLPLMLIGQPVRNAFLGYCFKNKGNLLSLTKSFHLLSLACFIFSILISMFLFFLGGYVFQLFFGASYYEAGSIAFLLSIWGVGAFTSYPSLALLRAFGQDQFILKLEATWCVVKLSTITGFGLIADELNISIAAYSIVSAFSGMLLFLKAKDVLSKLKRL